MRLNSAGHKCTQPNELPSCPLAPSSSRMDSSAVASCRFSTAGDAHRLIKSLHFVKQLTSKEVKAFGETAPLSERELKMIKEKV